MAKTFKNDPGNYYKLSEPFESEDAANEAIQKFNEEVSELRKKYKIRDLLMVLNGSTKYEEGVTDFMIVMNFGSALNQLSMAAYAFGVEKAEHSEMINRIATKSKK